MINEQQTSAFKPTPIGDVYHVNFFDGRVLTAEDLQEEQLANHLAQWQLGRSLGAGVVEGLAVQQDMSEGASFVRIEPGIAINKKGHVLELKQRELIDLGRSIVPAAPLSRSVNPQPFASCSAPDAKAVIPSNNGTYILVACPDSEAVGLAPKVAYTEANWASKCNSRYVAERIRFKVIPLENPGSKLPADLAADFERLLVQNPLSVNEKSRLRNLLAHICLGTFQENGGDAYADKARQHTSDEILNVDESASGLVADNEVPLGLVQWRGAGILFVDQWAVRRGVTARTTTTPAMPFVHQDVAIADATWKQFQAHMQDLFRQRDGEQVAMHVRAEDLFYYLPAAGGVPLGNAFITSPFSFFSGLSVEDPVFLEPEQVPSLFQAALPYSPVRLSENHRWRLYVTRKKTSTVEDVLYSTPYVWFVREPVAFAGYTESLQALDETQREGSIEVMPLGVDRAVIEEGQPVNFSFQVKSNLPLDGFFSFKPTLSSETLDVGQLMQLTDLLETLVSRDSNLVPGRYQYLKPCEQKEIIIRIEEVPAFAKDALVHVGLEVSPVTNLNFSRGFSTESLLLEEGGLACAAFSPDGNSLATGEDELVVWEAGTGKEMWRQAGSGVHFRSMAFSGDGKWLATGDTSGNVLIWDVATGKEIVQLEKHASAVNNITFDYSELLVSVSNKAVVSDVNNNQTLAEFDLQTVIHGVYFDGEQKFICVGEGPALVEFTSLDHERKSWGRSTEPVYVDLISKAFDGDADAISKAGLNRINAVAMSVKGMVAFAGESIGVLGGAFSLETNLRVLDGHDGQVTRVLYGENYAYLYSTGDDNVINVWDPHSGELLFKLNDQPDASRVLAWIELGPRLYVGLEDGSLTSWHVKTGPLHWTTEKLTPDTTWAANFFGGIYATTGDIATPNSLTISDLQSGLPMHTLVDPGQVDVTDLAFSEDGQYVATVGKNFLVWDAISGALIRKTPGLKLDTESQVFAFSEVDAHLAAGQEDGSVIILDTTTGRKLREAGKHKSEVTSLVYSRDGKRLASGSKSLIVWSVENEVVLLEEDAPHGAAIVTSLAFSFDGKHLAAGSDSAQVIVFGLEDGSKTPLRLPNLDEVLGSITSLAFNPEGTRLAVAGESIVIWDLNTRTIDLKLTSSQSPFNRVVFSADGQHLLSSGIDETIRTWDAKTGDAEEVFEGQASPIKTFAIQHDGSRLVSLHEDGAVAVRILGAIKEPPLEEPDQLSLKDLVHYKFIGDTELLFSIEHEVSIWDTDASRIPDKAVRDRSRVASSVFAFSSKEEFLATGDRTGRVFIRKVADGSVIQRFNVHANEATASPEINSLVFSPDGKNLAVGSKKLIIWDIPQERKELEESEPDGANILSIAYSKDGKRIAAGTEEGKVLIWDLETGERKTIDSPESEAIRSLAFNADGNLIATGGSQVIIWDSAALHELARASDIDDTFKLGAARQLTFSKDGKILKSRHDQQMDFLWNVETGGFEGSSLFDPGDFQVAIHNSTQELVLLLASGEQTVKIFHGDPEDPEELASWSIDDAANITQMMFTSDDRHVISVGNDIVFWNTRTGAKGKTISRLHPVSDERAIAFSEDENFLAAGDDQGNLALWDLRAPGAPGAVTMFEASIGSAVDVIAFSPVGTRVTYGGGDFLVLDYDGATDPIFVEAPSVSSLAYRPDGNHIAIGTKSSVVVRQGNRVEVLFEENHGPLDRGTGEEISLKAVGEDGVTALAYSHDGHKLAIAGNSILIWDSLDSKHILIPTGGTSSTRQLLFSPDGSRLYAISDEPAVFVWDIKTGGLIVKSKDHPSPIASIALNASGTRLLSMSEDGTLKLWDTQNMAELPTGLHATLATELKKLAARPRGNTSGDLHVDENDPFTWEIDPDEEVVQMMLSTEGNQLITAGRDVLVWDLENGDLLKRISPKHSDISEMVLSRDGSWLVYTQKIFSESGAAGYTVNAWTQQVDAVELDLSTSDHAGVLAISPDGKLLATSVFPEAGKSFESVALWNLETGEKSILPAALIHEGRISRLLFDPTSSLLVVEVDDLFDATMNINSGAVLLINIQTGRLMHHIQLKEFGNTRPCTAFDPLGKILAIGMNRGRVNGRIVLIDTWTGDLLTLKRSAANQIIENLTFHPNGQYLIVAWHNDSRPEDPINIYELPLNLPVRSQPISAAVGTPIIPESNAIQIDFLPIASGGIGIGAIQLDIAGIPKVKRDNYNVRVRLERQGQYAFWVEDLQGKKTTELRSVTLYAGQKEVVLLDDQLSNKMPADLKGTYRFVVERTNKLHHTRRSRLFQIEP